MISLLMDKKDSKEHLKVCSGINTLHKPDDRRLKYTKSIEKPFEEVRQIARRKLSSEHFAAYTYDTMCNDLYPKPVDEMSLLDFKMIIYVKKQT